MLDSELDIRKPHITSKFMRRDIMDQGEHHDTMQIFDQNPQIPAFIKALCNNTVIKHPAGGAAIKCSAELRRIPVAAAFPRRADVAARPAPVRIGNSD
ncbi:hypothetical protein PE067_00060 [Paracoccus sp. DMF-8]|uniref:hypothetical protein n=1 Tax=Paracoccus sp. DMF-8 TaxID=3019445 RepID=UPI0023E8A2DF|nr:hypothetical protein [Paracoccus sp. DMF-8]MDF3604690.1 hypothetical protein [Paracoccus sp. DMF-8]